MMKFAVLLLLMVWPSVAMAELAIWSGTGHLKIDEASLSIPGGRFAVGAEIAHASIIPTRIARLTTDYRDGSGDAAVFIPTGTQFFADNFPDIPVTAPGEIARPVPPTPLKWCVAAPNAPAICFQQLSGVTYASPARGHLPLARYPTAEWRPANEPSLVEIPNSRLSYLISISLQKLDESGLSVRLRRAQGNDYDEHERRLVWSEWTWNGIWSHQLKAEPERNAAGQIVAAHIEYRLFSPQS